MKQAAADGVTYPNGTALDVKQLMDPWLNQMGYPLLTVTRNCDGTADITARRYFNPLGVTADVSSPYKFV